MKRVILDTNYCSGGMRPAPMDTEFESTEFKLALVRYKSMDELIKEFPNSYFDKYGNFCNGSDKHDDAYTTNQIAPSYFAQMGHTLHQRYEVGTIPVSKWWYKVLDY